MSDWEIERPEHAPDRKLSVEAIEAPLEASSERAVSAQEAMRAAERELSFLVQEAVAAGTAVRDWAHV